MTLVFELTEDELSVLNYLIFGAYYSGDSLKDIERPSTTRAAYAALKTLTEKLGKAQEMDTP